MTASRRRPAAMPKPREAAILKAVLASLRTRWGLLAWRQNTGAMLIGDRFVRFGTPGQSDAAALLDGRYMAVEVKRPGNRPTAKQLLWLKAVNRNGGVGLWVDDVENLDAVMPRLLAGARVEIDDDGNQYLTDEPRGGDS